MPTAVKRSRGPRRSYTGRVPQESDRAKELRSPRVHPLAHVVSGTTSAPPIPSTSTGPEMAWNAQQRSGQQTRLHSLTGPMPAYARPQPRIVALVPAHNEAAGIAYAIQSLEAQSWPPDAIVVVADNCT